MAERPLAAPDLPTRALLSALASCCGATASNPLDILRARAQAQPSAALPALARQLLLEGPAGWRVALPASLLRECTYSATRISLYPTWKQLLSRGEGGGGGSSSLAVMLAAGACAGACGAVVGNPADLIKTRQMTAARAGGLLALALQCVREGGGVRALWRGVTPSAQRAAVITAAQLGSYDFVKRELQARLGLREGLGLHAASAGVAGLAATAASSPLDNAKTLFYTHASGRGLSVAGVLCGLVVSGGPRGLFRGFWAAWARLGVHTLVTLSSLESLRCYLGFVPL